MELENYVQVIDIMKNYIAESAIECWSSANDWWKFMQNVKRQNNLAVKIAS